MITNHLLKARYETLKRLDEEASHDIEKYVRNSHRIVIEVEKQYGLQFKYGDVQGGGIEPFAWIS